MTEEFTPTARWVEQPDGSWAPVRSTAAPSSSAAPTEDFLSPDEVKAGSGIIVTQNPDGTVTISSATRGYALWKWGGTVVADPGAGYLRVNGSGNQPRILAISETDADGVNRQPFFSVLQVGDFIVLTDDPAAPPITGFARYSITGEPIDRGTWWEIPAIRTDTTGTQTPPPLDTMLRLYGDLNSSGSGGLTAGDVIGGTNITVVDNGDGTVTISGAPNEVVIQDGPPAPPNPGPTHYPALWLDADEPPSSVVPPHTHPEYLEPPEILAGDNVTVTSLPNGSVIVAAAGGASGTGGTAHVAPEPPPNPVQGSLWVDVNDLQNPLLPAARLDAAAWSFFGFGYAWGPGTVTDDVASGGVRINWNENFTDGGPGAVCATQPRDWEAGKTYLAWIKVRGESGAAPFRICWPYTFSATDGVPGQWLPADGTDQETFAIWKPGATTNQRIGIEVNDSRGGDHTVIDIQAWDITGLTLPMSVWTGSDWIYVSGIGITKDQADGFYVPLTHLSDENPHPQYLRSSDLPTAGAVQSGATTALANDVEVTVDFNTEQFDYGDMFDLATPTRFVCPTDGLYRASAQVGFSANTTGYRQATLKRNGSAIANVRQQALANNLSSALQIERTYPCLAGDYFEVAARQNSGAALATVAGYSWTWMVVEKVR